MPADTTSHNVNDSFFEGEYKKLWRLFIPEELTKRELDFIFQYFNLSPGDSALDIMCGYGRHAIGLARKGVHVTAVDNLKDYIDEIKGIAESEDLPVHAVQSAALDFSTTEQFNLAICMGNSIN